MDGRLWGQLPSNLRDHIRRQADRRTWSAMNRAEPTGRRRFDALASSFLQRLSNLMGILNEYSPAAIQIFTRDDFVDVSLDRFGFVLGTRPRVWGTREQILRHMAPFIRRALEQEMVVTILLQSLGETIVKYKSPSYKLLPEYSYLLRFDVAFPDAKSAFLKRLQILLSYLKDHPQFYPFFFDRDNFPLDGFHVRVSPGRTEVTYLSHSEQYAIDDWDVDGPPLKLDPPEVLRFFGEAYKDDVELAMFVKKNGLIRPVQGFTPPSYNPSLYPGWT